MKDRKEINKKHNAKRKMLQVSLYEIDQKKMIKKYGNILSATEAKRILLEHKITILYQLDNTELNVLIVQLKKMGNNINQMAHVANQTKYLAMDIALKQELKNIDQILSLIYKQICASK